MDKINIYKPDQTNFTNTLVSCGYNSNSIDFFMHFLSWKTKIKGDDDFITKRIPMKYFESPDIFFLIYTQFSTYKEEYFSDWLKLIMNSFPDGINNTQKTQIENNISNNIITYINQQALYRIENVTSPDNFVEEEDTTPDSKKWNQARNLFKKHFSSYIRNVASWPLNGDKQLFLLYQNWLSKSLLMRPGSNIYLEFIDIYKRMESNLASLTNYKMNGEGLRPM